MRTCFCVYEQDGDEFIVYSPFLTLFGIGTTAGDAFQDFEEKIDEWIDDCAKMGGPPQPYLSEERFKLRPETIRTLYQVCKDYNCTMSEAVDLITARFKHSILPTKDTTDPESQ